MSYLKNQLKEKILEKLTGKSLCYNPADGELQWIYITFHSEDEKFEVLFKDYGPGDYNGCEWNECYIHIGLDFADVDYCYDEVEEGDEFAMTDEEVEIEACSRHIDACIDAWVDQALSDLDAINE